MRKKILLSRDSFQKITTTKYNVYFSSVCIVKYCINPKVCPLCEADFKVQFQSI